MGKILFFKFKILKNTLITILRDLLSILFYIGNMYFKILCFINIEAILRDKVLLHMVI